MARDDNAGSTLYVVDHNRDYAQVLEEQDAFGGTLTTYTYGHDLLSQDQGVGANYFHYDGLGSTRKLTNASGAVTDSYIYKAFGTIEAQNGSTDNAYLFTGEQYDDGLAQYYLRARYYDPANGRFTQMDTFQGVNRNPVTLHKYLYANANPAMFVDPSGYASFLAGLSIGQNAAIGLALGSVAAYTIGQSMLNASIGTRVQGVVQGFIASWEYTFGFPLTTMLAQAQISNEAERLTKASIANIAELANQPGPPHEHHTVPIYMCGAVNQDTVQLRPGIHRALHTALVAYNAVVEAAYQRNFNGSTKIFSYANKSAIQMLADTSSGRRVISKHLRVFYDFGWFATKEPEFRSTFEFESFAFIAGKTSRPGCQRN